MLENYVWPLRDQFLDRDDELERLSGWWDEADRRPVALYGRRRVGKSWLFRAFAHGKPALILVAEELAEGAQLTKFAGALEPALGLRPDLPDVPSLFRALYRLARERQTLVVLDEFPYLLPNRDTASRQVQTAIAAVMEEERDASRLKLLLCGSQVSSMEKLLGEGSALRGRLTPLALRPLSFAQAAPFIEDSNPVARIARYAIAGGMPLYLDELARGGPIGRRIARRVLDPRGPLFNEPRDVLERELREPGVYFSILEELSTGPKRLEDLSSALRMRNTSLTSYMKALRDLRLVDRTVPINAPESTPKSQYRLVDHFFRFWFRFTFPYQAQLESGLRPEALYEGEIRPLLAEHVAPTFEDLCRTWTREAYGEVAARIGPWWGDGRHDLRRSGERQTEEIDIVGIGRNRVNVVGECKWTNKPLSVAILADLERFKLPALVQSGAKLKRDGPQMLLFSRSGFTDGLKAAAEKRPLIRLVDAAEVVAGGR